MLILKGRGVAGGIVCGKIIFYDRSVPEVKKTLIVDREAERLRFECARKQACDELDALNAHALESIGEQEAEIFEIHRMMLDDTDYVESITDKISGEGFCAEYAVDETAQVFAETFSSMTDNEYMQARAADVRDISGRIIGILTGHRGTLELHEPSIVVTDDLAPSETVSLARSLLLAIVTSGGSTNSHTAILSRTMGIPAIVTVDGVSAGLDGRIAIANAATGELCVDPDEAALASYGRMRDELAHKAQMLKTLVGKPNETLDGHSIKLFANIGSPSDIDAAIANDAGGIGLFRSEFLYLESDGYPSEDTQLAAYREVLERMGDREVVIRTLDIGADKKIGYFELPEEENPALGFRAIRICLERPEIFKTQLRALLRASVYGNLQVMFPMIASEWEIDRIKELVSEAKIELDTRKESYSDSVKWGIMVETPAAAVISDLLAKKVDFFSIGTNDLTQYTLAADRQNAGAEKFADPRHEAVLRLIELTVKNAHAAGIWVGICGELAADPSLTEKFLRFGVDELSMSPTRILEVRERVRSLDLN